MTQDWLEGALDAIQGRANLLARRYVEIAREVFGEDLGQAAGWPIHEIRYGWCRSIELDYGRIWYRGWCPVGHECNGELPLSYLTDPSWEEAIRREMTVYLGLYEDQEARRAREREAEKRAELARLMKQFPDMVEGARADEG